MRNIFSEGPEGERPEPDPLFAQQARLQAGGPPQATATETAAEVPLFPLNPTNPVRPAVLPNPNFADLAEKTAPSSAVSSARTYHWPGR